MKILIVKFGALGDVVRTSYILKGLRDKYENANIIWFTSDLAYDLLRFNPLIDDIVTPNFKYNLIKIKEIDLMISFDDELKILELVKNLNIKKIIGSYLINNLKIQYTESSKLWFDMGLLSKYGKEVADQKKKDNLLEHNQIMEQILKIN